MSNFASIPTSISPITSSNLPISHTTSDTVGATIVDKLNEKADKLVNIFLSPYLGKEDVVNYFEPQYHYLPPQQQPAY